MNEKVLVIDDEQDSINSICDYLNDIKNISCRGENDPQRAIENFQANPTDIVVVDYLLSDINGINGLDIISQLKDIKPFTRFILISGFIPSEIEVTKQLSDKTKVDRYISKPIDAKELTKVIEEFLESIESKSKNWLEISKEYVEKGKVSAEEIREINEEFKQSIIDALDSEGE